jgi:hypothetical protein
MTYVIKFYEQDFGTGLRAEQRADDDYFLGEDRAGDCARTIWNDVPSLTMFVAKCPGAIWLIALFLLFVSQD